MQIIINITLTLGKMVWQFTKCLTLTLAVCAILLAIMAAFTYYVWVCIAVVVTIAVIVWFFIIYEEVSVKREKARKQKSYDSIKDLL